MDNLVQKDTDRDFSMTGVDTRLRKIEKAVNVAGTIPERTIMAARQIADHGFRLAVKIAEGRARVKGTTPDLPDPPTEDDIRSLALAISNGSYKRPHIDIAARIRELREAKKWT